MKPLSTTTRNPGLMLDLLIHSRHDDKTLQPRAYRNSTGFDTPPSEMTSPTFNNWSKALRHETSASDCELPEVVSLADSPTVAVLGVGYVGTHLVNTFATKYPVIGFDVSKTRINDLTHAQSRVSELVLDQIEYTWDACALRKATHFLISVPTLLRHDRTIDASYISKALQTVMKHARPGSTIVIESSVAVGMTRELLGPMALQMGFFAGMSPEVHGLLHLLPCCIILILESELIPVVSVHQSHRYLKLSLV